jgi:hypothetical protein
LLEKKLTGVPDAPEIELASRLLKQLDQLDQDRDGRFY